MSRVAADRLAALTQVGARAACAMIHLVEGHHLRLIGGHDLPPGFEPLQQVPVSSTLAGVVLRAGRPLVIGDVEGDERVPAAAPVRAVGIRAYAGFPVRDPAGAVVGVCAVMDYQVRHWRPDELNAVDNGAQACTAFVAEQWAHEAEHQQRLFLNTMLDSLDTGVAACDADGRLVVVNRSLRERLELPAEITHLDKWVNWLPITTPDGDPVDRTQTPLRRALHGTEVRGTEFALRTRDGRRLVRVNAHPITNRQGRRLGAVAVFHDITEARHAEYLQRMLSRSKDEYLNLVGHELRTPVTIILAYLDAMSDAEPDTPAAELYPVIDGARRGSERLRRLVEALLDLSALDAGRTPLEMADVDLVAVVTSAAHTAEDQAAAKNITLTRTVPAAMPLRGDAARLTQMVTVLLDNAITYTPDGGTVTVTVAGTGDTATIEVTDTGLEIPDDERPHVFDRFFRGAVATERAIPGAGLGLPIAKLIVDHHHGTITISTSTHPPGTTMHVELPRTS
ncbi:two-component system, OmpR family, phosphate regulon sensor histidine kinase PhoR [Paractinoplanes atraurantiacus]|uniref:histidine kinase n=2 Tax=Paractinoplanes atraurantiacus TaxID=1036182 RepID=A0A285IRR4_9ACTN|nr:two-component system, OmpR family, phosphate regulon sensor histidine kinase PhoR [Actinoplanes atraurantiacus]